MSLVDIINKVPLKLASQFVDLTGKSKYDLAQVCNFGSGAISALAAFDSYYQSSVYQIGIIGVISGGIFTAFNIALSLYNNERKHWENPESRIEAMDALHVTNRRLGKNVTREQTKKFFEETLESASYGEKKMASSGLYQVLNAIGLGVLIYLGNESLTENYNSVLHDGVHLAKFFSISLFLSGLSFYFRGSSPKYENKDSKIL